MYDFTIIGAGYGGLSAAALLSQKGKKVIVVEKAKYVGGRSLYFEEDGFIWQYGQHSHRLEKDGFASKVFDRLGDPLEFINVDRDKAVLFYKGKLFKRPEGIGAFLTTDILSFKARFIFIKFYIKFLRQNPNNWYDKTLQEFYRTYFDNKEVEAFLSFLGFTIMLPDISAVSAGEVMEFLQRAMKAKVKQGDPVGGAKQVIDKLVNAIESNGGEIRKEEKASEIVIENKAAKGIVTNKGQHESRNVVFAAPLKNLSKIIDPALLDATLMDYCNSIENSSGVVIDFVSKEPLSDYNGGILGVDMPLWVKFQTLIDPDIAPPGYHVCTWGLLVERGKYGDQAAVEETEKKLREAASLCMPGYEKKVIRERKMVMPVVNANMLIPSQSKHKRPDIKSKDIENLYFVGDTTKGDGCSGDIAFSSAMKLTDMV